MDILPLLDICRKTFLLHNFVSVDVTWQETPTIRVMEILAAGGRSGTGQPSAKLGRGKQETFRTGEIW